MSGVENVEIRNTEQMRMYEELMQENDVEPTDIPILDIFKDNKLVVTFKPKGLWIIGANGRIDILTESNSYILVDVAERFAKSEWKVYSQNNRKKGFTFDEEFIKNLVNSK